LVVTDSYGNNVQEGGWLYMRQIHGEDFFQVNSHIRVDLETYHEWYSTASFFATDTDTSNGYFYKGDPTEGSDAPALRIRPYTDITGEMAILKNAPISVWTYPGFVKIVDNVQIPEGELYLEVSDAIVKENFYVVGVVWIYKNIQLAEKFVKVRATGSPAQEVEILLEYSHEASLGRIARDLQILTGIRSPYPGIVFKTTDTSN
jgi:hypothetical protein